MNKFTKLISINDEYGSVRDIVGECGLDETLGILY